jgi:threonine dehydrogenase-like Zn-dependent dehydrogenase
MRAVWVGSAGVELRERPEPALGGPHDVKLRVLEVGVCGTDRELLESGTAERPPGEDGLVLGHEALGEVIEVGSEVTTISPGDLAVPMVRTPCPHPECTACRVGRQDFCFTGDYRERGIKGAHGFMSERVVVPEEHLVPVPPALRDVAVLTEPLTIAEKGLEQAKGVQSRLPAPGWHHDTVRHEGGPPGRQRHTALVLGAGPVGLLGAMALVVRDYRTVVYSREPSGGPRARLVAAFGAEYVSGAEVPLADAMTFTGPIDLVYEATGAARIAFDALPLLGPNGLFVLTGVPGRRGPVELDPARVVRNLVLKNQVLLGTVNAGSAHFAAAVRDLALFRTWWPDVVRGLVTSRFPLASVADALAARPLAVKHVVDVAGRTSER